MNELLRISRPFLGYLKRSNLYPELFLETLIHIINRGNTFKNKEETNSWAVSQSISQKAVIGQLFNIEMGSLKKEYQEFFKKTEQKETLPEIFIQYPSFEVVHYNSDKSYNVRMWVYDELYNRLRKGKLFISDRSAYQYFCGQNEINTRVVGFEGRYIGVFAK